MLVVTGLTVFNLKETRFNQVLKLFFSNFQQYCVMIGLFCK